jgi:predicted GNAT family N-acyltransferase
MIEAFDKAKHHRKNFDCGNERLNAYLQKQVSQDIKKKLTACFMLTDSDRNVIGYYTLAAHSIAASAFSTLIPPHIKNSYASIPVTLLGRLAVNEAQQGRGIGIQLLMDALIRACNNSLIVGSHAVIVDPIDDNAKKFYLEFGFIPLPDSGKLFLPMGTIVRLIHQD